MGNAWEVVEQQVQKILNNFSIINAWLQVVG
jgi:hypothetical protein